MKVQVFALLFMGLMSSVVSAENFMLSNNDKVSGERHYIAYGVESLSLTIANEENRFSALKFGYGYRLTDNISIEGVISAPISGSTKTGSVTDTMRSLDTAFFSTGGTICGEGGTCAYPVTSVTHRNELSLEYVGKIGLRLEFPLSEHYDVFFRLGYMHMGYDQTTVTGTGGLPFVDNVPSADPSADYLSGITDQCLLQGLESLCGNDLVSQESSNNEGDIFYGVGARLYYNDQTTLMLTYGKSNMDNVDVETISINFESFF
jgi:hypothetical protein